MGEVKPLWKMPDAFWESVGPLMFTPEAVERAAADVAGLLSLIGVAPGAHVLDRRCGVGRHTLELVRRRYSVVGVDRTAAYLGQARLRAKAEGLAVELLHQDMREFVRPEAFDLALNLGSSFGYFEDPADDMRVLEKLHASLRPGGALVLETIGKEVLTRIFQARDWSEEEGYLFLQERRPSDDWGRMNGRWIKITDGEREE